MPLQCELSWQTFQVAEDEEQRKRWLLDQCRPSNCPYCKQHHTMICHQYIKRYIIVLISESESKTIILIIVCFKCKECGHTIRVLPKELHSHSNHLSQTIKDLIMTKLETGRYTGKKRVPKYLQRHYYKLYLKRCQEIVNLKEEADIKLLIQQLPMFSILFRSNYQTVRESDPTVYHSRTHRILPLIVFLDTS